MVPCLLGLGAPSSNQINVIGSHAPLSVNGLHVGNPALAFRQRRKPLLKKTEPHSAQNNRPQILDLPPLIVTRLSRNV